MREIFLSSLILFLYTTVLYLSPKVRKLPLETAVYAKTCSLITPQLEVGESITNLLKYGFFAPLLVILKEKGHIFMGLKQLWETQKQKKTTGHLSNLDKNYYYNFNKDVPL